MGIYITLDPGSTHNHKLDYARELIDIASDCGADCIKFQLFPDTPEFTIKGNVPLPYDWFPGLMSYGQKKHIRVAASVFDWIGLQLCMQHNVPYIKFAYSQKSKRGWMEGPLNMGKRLFVSADTMSLPSLPENSNITRLYCIPEYPVKYEVAFDGLFPPFDGFSDHTLGYQQTIRATEFGAKYIEKHITLPYSDITCPDKYFALNAREAGLMVKKLREMWPE